MKPMLLAVVLAFTAFQEQEQHYPVACGREDDRDRPEDKVACECFHEQDPCDKDRPETRSCGAYCNKSLCGCCMP